MLFIHNDVVAKLLTMRECIDVQEHAFRQIPSGGAVNRPRIDMYVPCEREDGYYRWGTAEGTNDGIFAIRMKSDVITWPVGNDGLWRENKYCIKPGTYCGLILLMSTRNGEPLAFINDGVLQHMRVGGGAGIGARHLARREFELRRHFGLRRHGANIYGSVPGGPADQAGQGLQSDAGEP